MINTLRKKELPLAPEEMHISATTPNTLEFEWKPPRNARQDLPTYGYEVCYQVEGQTAKRRLVDGFTTSYKVHGLRPNTLVQGILVRGRNEFGWGPSNLPAISGRSAAAPPGQVDWIEVLETGPYSASLKWSKPELDNGASISNYKIRYYQPGHAEAYCEVETGSGDCEYMCWALKPGTPYFFSVCAQNRAGWGAWVSLNAYGLTKSAPPNEPDKVRVTKSSVNEIHLAWERPYSNGSKVVLYEVVYEESMGRTRSCLLRPNGFGADDAAEDGQEQQVLQGIEAGTLLYKLQVRAKNLAGWGAFSAPISASTTGMLVAWGRNDSGQLGDEPSEAPHGWSELPSMRSLKVEAVSAGARHTVVVCQGEVYTWGANQVGQLGRFSAGDSDWMPGRVQLGGHSATQTGAVVEGTSSELVKYPRLKLWRQDGPSDYVGSLGGYSLSAGSCVAAAAGGWHTLLLTSDGEVCSFGRGLYGCLGLGDEVSVPLPRFIDSLAGLRVELVACGERHSACLAGGAAFTWGCGSDGQLGHGRRADEHAPRRVEALWARQQRVCGVACGEGHTCWVDEGGGLHTCGEGRDGRLGLGDELPRLSPSPVPGLLAVSAAACGRYHTACVAQGHALYTFGSGTQGQLGYPDGAAPSSRLPSTLGVSPAGPWKQLLPRPVPALAPGRAAGGVRHVVCGPAMTAAVTRDQGLWVWGTGPAVAALTGSDDAVAAPLRVPRLQERYLSLLACGEAHALAVLTKFAADEDLAAPPPPPEGGDAQGGEGQQQRVCDDVEEASVAGRELGYPLLLGGSEEVLLLYLAGRRETRIDTQVKQCYTEAQLRADFALLSRDLARLNPRSAPRPRLAVARLPRPSAALGDDAQGGQGAAAVAELEQARQAFLAGGVKGAAARRRSSVGLFLAPPTALPP